MHPMRQLQYSWRPQPRGGLLLTCGWLACLALLPRPTAAATTNEPLAAPDIAGALRVVGLPFSEAEQTQMLGSVQRSLEAFSALRLRQFPDSTPPALRFDPRPNGWVPPQPVPSNPPPVLPRIQRPTSSDDLAFLPVTDLAALLQSRQVTSEELTRLALDRLRRYGPGLHCVVSLTEERALVAARRADTEIQAGRWRGPLHGIPYGAKDLLATRGIPTTWGARSVHKPGDRPGRHRHPATGPGRRRAGRKTFPR
jgi:hypothetical protein